MIIKKLKILLQLRFGNKEECESSTYVPKSGEPYYNTTDNILKIGDNIHTYKELPSIGGSSYTKGEGISIDNQEISVNKSTATSLGGIKVGFVASGDNYPVKIDDNGNAYVTVPKSGMLIATTEDELESMALDSSNIGQVVKYIGETGKYNQDSFYLIEENE